MSSPPSHQTVPPPGGPLAQPVTLLLPDGTPFNVTMDQFAWFHAQMSQMAISRGTALGATAVTLLAVAFLTQPAKRSSPVFALNVAALSFNVLRTLFMAIWVASDWTDPYAVIANDWARITATDVGNSVAVPVFTLLALGAVLASLMLQVRVALSTARRRVRRAVLALCGLLALGSLGTEMAVMVVNIRTQIVDLTNTARDLGWAKLVEANNLVMLLAFLLFTLVFVAKLGDTIWQQVRRLGGAQRFGPLQVLFIMGVQTLIVPSEPPFLLLAPSADRRSHHDRPAVLDRGPRDVDLVPDRRVPVAPAVLALGRRDRRRPVPGRLVLRVQAARVRRRRRPVARQVARQREVSGRHAPVQLDSATVAAQPGRGVGGCRAGDAAGEVLEPPLKGALVGLAWPEGHRLDFT